MREKLKEKKISNKIRLYGFRDFTSKKTPSPQRPPPPRAYLESLGVELEMMDESFHTSFHFCSGGRNTLGIISSKLNNIQYLFYNSQTVPREILLFIYFYMYEHQNITNLHLLSISLNPRFNIFFLNHYPPFLPFTPSPKLSKFAQKNVKSIFRLVGENMITEGCYIFGGENKQFLKINKLK